MDDRSMMLLVNPAAGRSTSAAALGAVIEEFCSADWHPTVYFTNRRATEQVRDYASGYARVVCLGGDGTLSQSIAGLMELPAGERPPLGYIPMGTANDVANTLNLPLRKPAAAARDVVCGQPMPYDVGRMNGQSFTYVAAFGAFTAASYATDQDMKNALGKAAYVLSGFTMLPKLKSYRTRVEFDGGVIEDELIFGAVSNSTSVAGMIKLDRRVVDLSDGRFEMLLVRTPKNVADLNIIVSGIINQEYNNSLMTLHQTGHVRFIFEEAVPWTRDGENGGDHQTVEIDNVKNAVTLIV